MRYLTFLLQINKSLNSGISLVLVGKLSILWIYSSQLAKDTAHEIWEIKSRKLKIRKPYPIRHSIIHPTLSFLKSHQSKGIEFQVISIIIQFSLFLSSPTVSESVIYVNHIERKFNIYKRHPAEGAKTNRITVISRAFSLWEIMLKKSISNEHFSNNTTFHTIILSFQFHFYPLKLMLLHCVMFQHQHIINIRLCCLYFSLLRWLLCSVFCFLLNLLSDSSARWTSN